MINFLSYQIRDFDSRVWLRKSILGAKESLKTRETPLPPLFLPLLRQMLTSRISTENAASFGLNAFFGKAVLGLLQAFCFNWIYFELDGADLYAHASTEHRLSCFTPPSMNLCLLHLLQSSTSNNSPQHFLLCLLLKQP